MEGMNGEREPEDRAGSGRREDRPTGRPGRDGSRAPADGRTAVSPRLVGILSALLLASWLLSMAPLPLSLASGLTALAALGVLVPVVLQAFRAGRRALALLGALVGVPATLMMVLAAVVSLLFYGPMSELQDCRAQALTERAKAQCDQQVEDSVATWIGSVTGG